MIKEYCDLSGKEITDQGKYSVTVLKHYRLIEGKDNTLARPVLVISPLEMVELENYITSRRKV